MSEDPKPASPLEAEAEHREYIDWLARSFVEHGTWPRYEETAVFLFRRELPFGRVEANSHGAFDQVHQGSNEPARYALTPAVLFELGVCPRAFEVGSGLLTRAIEDMARTGSGVTVTRGKLAAFEGVSPEGVLMKQVEFLLSRSELSLQSLGGRDWEVQVSFQLLRHPVPTFERVFLKRYPSPVERATPTGTLHVGSRAGSRRIARRPTDWVFVASTWEDLTAHRDAVMWAILGQKRMPLGMELWAPDGGLSLERSLAEVAEASVMILLVGCRYGSTPRPGDERSFVEIEYDTARERGIDVLPFLPDRSITWRQELWQPDMAPRLSAFRARLEGEQLVHHYKSVEDLKHAVAQGLRDWDARRER